MNRFKFFVVSILALCLAFPAMARYEYSNEPLGSPQAAADFFRANPTLAAKAATVLKAVYSEDYSGIRPEDIPAIMERSVLKCGRELGNPLIRGYGDAPGRGALNVYWPEYRPMRDDECGYLDQQTGLLTVLDWCANPAHARFRLRSEPPADEFVIREHDREHDGRAEAEAEATASIGDIHLHTDGDGGGYGDCYGLTGRKLDRCYRHLEKIAELEAKREIQIALAYGPKPSQEAKWAGFMSGLMSGNTYAPSRVDAPTFAPTLTNAPTRIITNAPTRVDERTSVRNFPPPVVVPPVIVPPIVGGGGCSGGNCPPAPCFTRCPCHNVCVTDHHHFHAVCQQQGGPVFGNPGGTFGGGPVFGNPGGIFGRQ